jgi:hypothetical protein
MSHKRIFIYLPTSNEIFFVATPCDKILKQKYTHEKLIQ